MLVLAGGRRLYACIVVGRSRRAQSTVGGDSRGVKMRRRPKAPSTLVLALLATLYVPSSADAASVAPQRRKPLGPAPARADAPPAARQEILAVLERYRRATEARELPALAAVYVDFPPERQAAQRRYFENVRDLKVAIENVDIAVVGADAVVTDTRTDDVPDLITGRPMHASLDRASAP